MIFWWTNLSSVRNAELFQQGAKVYAYEISLVLHVYSCIILSDSMVTKLLIIDSLCHKIAECMEQMLVFSFTYVAWICTF